MKRLSADDPRSIGGYRLLGTLGEGGMGRVYLARSDRGRTVAVKVVRRELARHPDFRRRFAQEIRAAQRVGTSPQDAVPGGGPAPQWTAPVLDFDTEAEVPWVATGYIAGPTLSEVVDEQYGPLPEQTVSALACGLGGALRAIHGAGLVHRDFKPSNILITIDGPRVIDFGIARALDGTVQSAAGLTHTGAMVGSPGFMSPEQVRGLAVTPASDIFCLGTVLTYAATGRMPFGSEESGVHAVLFRIAEEEPDLTGLTGPIRDTVQACLAKDPADRPRLDELGMCSGRKLESPWLPGEVLAQLGRHAVQLLDCEEPEAEEATRRLRLLGPGTRNGGPATGAAAAGALRDAVPRSVAEPLPLPGAQPAQAAAPAAAAQVAPAAAAAPAAHSPLPGALPAAYGTSTSFGAGIGPGPAGTSGSGSGYGTAPTSGAGTAYATGTPAGGTPAGYGAGPASPYETSPYESSPQLPPLQQTPPPAPHWQQTPPALQATYPAGSPYQGLPVVPGPGTPPPPSRSAVPFARPARASARVLAVLLGAVAVWALGRLAFSIPLTSALHSVADPYSGQSLLAGVPGFGSLRTTSLVLQVLGAPLLGAVTLTWSIWFWRMRANAAVLAVGRRLRYAPEMAVASFFIPLCNFVVPKQVLNDVWTASHPLPPHPAAYGPSRTVGRGLVHAWWWVWLGYFCCTLFGDWTPWWAQDTPLGARKAVQLAQVTDVLCVAAAVLAIVLVVRLTALQNARVAELQPRVPQPEPQQHLPA